MIKREWMGGRPDFDPTAGQIARFQEGGTAFVQCHVCKAYLSLLPDEWYESHGDFHCQECKDAFGYD